MGTNQLTGLDFKIREIAARIRDLREIMGYSTTQMAAFTGVPESEYIQCESGKHDLHFAFLYRCALTFRVDVTDLIEGHSPKLRSYTLTRAGAGQKIEGAHSMDYFNMAYDFQNRIAEPLYVVNRYSEKAQTRDIDLTTHEGQECDLIIRGSMKVQIGEHIEVLHVGDCIYYDSATPHGMIAVGGEDCLFYAIVLNPAGEGTRKQEKEPRTTTTPAKRTDSGERIYQTFIRPTEDKRGKLTAISFLQADRFNFAFDIVDALGTQKPDKLAMLHRAVDGTERRFTFSDMKKESARAANYFKALGVKKGDRVMLVLKRHYQFWFCILGLHKLGAVAIPSTYLLQINDYDYRFRAAGVKAIICTADGACADCVDEAATGFPTLETKILVGGARDGWHDFDSDYPMYSSHFSRTEETPCGRDQMLMFFTSGTSGYPKIAAHNFQYPLGHFITAKYWHCVDPDGLHLTISDSGWAKALWGKLYGQWLCEGAVFTYDFDRFDAEDILPLFGRYHITTFCAPPTMYRMLIKQDLSRFDLSSVRHASTAGEALNPEVFRQFRKATGLQIMEGFGQSETTLVIGNLAGDQQKLGSMGKPVPLYNVKLLSPEGTEVAMGETGEICISLQSGLPAGLCYEYYGEPELTAATWRDGFYHTGDLAWRDEDGFFFYVGRADDVIKSSGYRIGPFEIESVIMELPYVLECGVSAAPDEVRGQIVKASIVLTEGTVPTDDLKREIQSYVKQHTSPYKYPRLVEFRDALPKTTSGKIIRKEL